MTRITRIAVPLRSRSNARSPWGVTDSHATLRRPRTRFDSWRGYCVKSELFETRRSSLVPASVSGARRSSKPQGRVRFPGGGVRSRNVLGVCRIAHDSTKVGDQVQFLARTLILPLDAGARRSGNRLQPGSSGFDPHQRLLRSSSFLNQLYRQYLEPVM